MKKVIVLSLLAISLTAISVPASAAARFGFGLGYGRRVYVPGPAFWAPPVYYSFPARSSNFGELKVDTNAKDASVYINGAFAGTVGKLKTVWLRSGSYDIEVRSTNGGVFDQKVFVPMDKKIVIEPVFTNAS